MLDAFDSNLIQHFIIFQVCCATFKFSNVSFERFFDNGMFFSGTFCKQICSKEKSLNSWQRRKSAWQLSQMIQKIIPINRETPSKNKLRRKILRRLTRQRRVTRNKIKGKGLESKSSQRVERRKVDPAN